MASVNGVADCGGLKIKLPPAAQFNIPRAVLREILASAFMHGRDGGQLETPHQYAEARLAYLDEGSY